MRRKENDDDEGHDGEKEHERWRVFGLLVRRAMYIVESVSDSKWNE